MKAQPERRTGIIPAYAGSTRARTRIPHLVQDHPRIRGEHPVCDLHQVFLSGSSPHTRGAPERQVARVLAVGIIPAYAGSTHCGARRLISRPDHPRIRGEHCGDAYSTGSGYRIIPAYAGSTA